MTLWRKWRQGFRALPKRVIAFEGPRLEDIANLNALAEAWGRVRANKGGPGGDGVTIESITPFIDRELERLRDDMLMESYRPRPLRRAAIRKPNGSMRHLAIPAIIDRVAQTAVLIVLEPHLDERMSEASWAYRPGRSVDQAIAAVGAARAAGFIWTVDADIANYFESISHRQLKNDLTIWIDDERILRLLAKWLRTFGWRGRGVAQGAPISPLFANLYLHPLDRQVRAQGAEIVRYADDFVVLVRTAGAARRILRDTERQLRYRGLALNRDKTRIVAPEEELIFLGQRLRRHRVLSNSAEMA